MPHHFRPYPPEQPLLLPPGPTELVARGSPGVHGERTGGRAGSVGLLRPLRAARLRQFALCAGHDGKNFGLRLCHGGDALTAAGAETGRGWSLPGAGGGKSAAAAYPLRISAAAPGGLRGGGGGAGPGTDVAGHLGAGQH